MEQEKIIDSPQELSKRIDNTIGINKYNHLKSLKPELLTEDQKEQMKAFEEKRSFTPEEQILKSADYFEKIFQVKEKTEVSLNSRELWILFKKHFQLIHGKPFLKTPETIQNLEPILYYFAKDERFFKCANLTRLSEPSFDKGLLIIGAFGNGKTSVMKAFESMFRGVKGIGFKGYSANEVVTMFEKISNEDGECTRKEFESIMFNGVRYFDDLKTERIASNYGKVNIFKDILEERYNRNAKTHITCNFKDGFNGNIEIGLQEFGEKYGGRVYDRVFEMYNIIEFKGKSFRK
jgi:DNA replication protein DnaC